MPAYLIMSVENRHYGVMTVCTHIYQGDALLSRRDQHECAEPVTLSTGNSTDGGLSLGGAYRAGRIFIILPVNPIHW